MSKKFLRSMMILLTAWVLALTACGRSSARAGTESDTTKEIHLAVILGSHNNAPKINLGLIEEEIYETCLSYGSVTLVCDDGAPYNDFDYHDYCDD